MDFNIEAGETIFNKASIKKAGVAGCLECAATFDSEEIEEWVEGEAVCPNCLYKKVVGLYFGGTTLEKLSLISSGREGNPY